MTEEGRGAAAMMVCSEQYFLEIKHNCDTDINMSGIPSILLSTKTNAKFYLLTEIVIINCTGKNEKNKSKLYPSARKHAGILFLIIYSRMLQFIQPQK